MFIDFETAAHTLCYAFGLLALYQDEQDKLFEQCKAVSTGDGLGVELLSSCSVSRLIPLLAVPANGKIYSGLGVRLILCRPP